MRKKSGESGVAYSSIPITFTLSPFIRASIPSRTVHTQRTRKTMKYRRKYFFPWEHKEKSQWLFIDSAFNAALPGLHEMREISCSCLRKKDFLMCKIEKLLTVSWMEFFLDVLMRIWEMVVNFNLYLGYFFEDVWRESWQFHAEYCQLFLCSQPSHARPKNWTPNWLKEWFFVGIEPTTSNMQVW